MKTATRTCEPSARGAMRSPALVIAGHSALKTRVDALMTRAIHPLRKTSYEEMMDHAKSGLPDFARFKYASRVNPTCVVKPGGDGSRRKIVSEQSCGPASAGCAFFLFSSCLLLLSRASSADPIVAARNRFPFSSCGLRGNCRHQVVPGVLFFFLLFAGTADSRRHARPADEGSAYFAGLGFELRSGAPPGLNPKLLSSSSAA